jgi:hypothetical protein
MQNLNCEPKADEDDGRDFEEERQKKNRDDNDDPRPGEQADVASHCAGNGPRGTQRRLGGGGVDDRMCNRRENPAGEIEDEITSVAHPVLDRSPEQPKRPHVQDQMQPSSMQEHVGKERLPVGERVPPDRNPE